MRVRVKLILLFIVILSIDFGYYFYEKYSLGERPVSLYESKHKNSVLRIGIIGDNRTGGVTLDTIIRDEFAKRGLKTEIISFAEPEAKTTPIYNTLYACGGTPYSGSEILRHNLDYCIIWAGKNSNTDETGAKFYAYYCSLLIGDLRRNHTEPVFISTPYLGFKENTDSLGVLVKARNGDASLIIDNGSTGSLDEYRKQVNKLLKDTYLQDSAIVVPFRMVRYDDERYKILYRNDNHLAIPEKKKMGKIIVQYILNKEHYHNLQFQQNRAENKGKFMVTPGGGLWGRAIF